MSLIPMEQQASIAAIAQGNLPSIRLLAEDLYARLGALEDAGSVIVPNKFQGIDPASPPADDAKSVDVREAVIDLTEKVNELIRALKNG